MECQSSDSKKLFKVFDASKRKRTRKKREGLDDSNSIATDDSTSGCQAAALRITSAKASLQDVPTAQTVAATTDPVDAKRGQDSSPSRSRSPGREHRSSRSPRHHRRTAREGVSLALKAGLVSTPRSMSTHKEMDGGIDSIPQDQESFIYAFLEEAIKRDKKRHTKTDSRQRDRHSRRHEERRVNRELSPLHDCRHHHRRRREDSPKERERPIKNEPAPAPPAIDQAVLFETFAKLCATLNEKNATYANPANTVPRTLSHKSLQCEVVSRRESYDVDRHPVRLRSHENSRDNVSKTKSHENFRGRDYSRERALNNSRIDEKCACCDKEIGKYSSKLNMTRSRMRNIDDERYPHYPPEIPPPRSHMEHGYRPRPDNRDYRDYDREFPRDKHYDSDKRRYYEQKTSRSYDVHRDGYPDDDKFCRRTARSDNNAKDKHYEEREKYYEEKHAETRDRYIPGKERRGKRNGDRYDRNSIASKDDDYRDRDRYSERERDSGLSVADGEISTVSGKSNCLKVVKQEIAEQREAMDKMMKLWKELMRCFKGMSAQGQTKSQVNESAANVQESAAAQLRLWRECMRRYETVARDVGDTDARLMEEINKQRSEMAEMAGMWQECLQRYREMSSDFNNLKQQVTITKQQYVTPESPTRLPAAPIACAEGEGTVPPAPYRLPPHYPQMPPMPSVYPGGGGSPLRSRASAPPAWWWCGEGPRESPRRRSSPESRGSRDRDRDRRHRHKDRDDTRYKEKSSKPSAARSEHRHRKR